MEPVIKLKNPNADFVLHWDFCILALALCQLGKIGHNLFCSSPVKGNF